MATGIRTCADCNQIFEGCRKFRPEFKVQWALGDFPQGRGSRWPSVEMPSLTFLLIIKSLLKTSFVTFEVRFAETCCLGTQATIV